MAEPNQTDGRKANAAQPLDAGKPKGPEQYPGGGAEGGVTGPGSANPEPPQGAGDGNLGPAGDPAEGKR